MPFQYGKDGFITAHDELIDEYMEHNEGASLDEATLATEPQVWDRYQDNLADAIDRATDRWKESKQYDGHN